MKWIGSFRKKPKKVFLVHGEDSALTELSKLLDEELGIPNEIAQFGQTIELSATAYRMIGVERAIIHKDSLINILNELRNDFDETLEDVESRILEEDYLKLDSLMYMLEKIQDNLDELKIK